VTEQLEPLETVRSVILIFLDFEGSPPPAKYILHPWLSLLRDNGRECKYARSLRLFWRRGAIWRFIGNHPGIHYRAFFRFLSYLAIVVLLLKLNSSLAHGVAIEILWRLGFPPQKRIRDCRPQFRSCNRHAGQCPQASLRQSKLLGTKVEGDVEEVFYRPFELFLQLGGRRVRSAA